MRENPTFLVQLWEEHSSYLPSAWRDHCPIGIIIIIIIIIIMDNVARHALKLMAITSIIFFDATMLSTQ